MWSMLDHNVVYIVGGNPSYMSQTAPPCRLPDGPNSGLRGRRHRSTSVGPSLVGLGV